VNYKNVNVPRQGLVKSAMLVFMARHGCWSKGSLTAPEHIILTVLIDNRNTFNFAA
jgi:hypothetical protein